VYCPKKDEFFFCKPGLVLRLFRLVS
jgi:hypothetical protein